MNNKKNDLSIIVNTCDAYEDVLKLFFAAFDEYWPECEYSVYINTEKKQYNYARTTDINYHATRLVSYYAFFKGWLLLSQPPGCLSNSTSFSTELSLWDLSW